MSAEIDVVKTHAVPLTGSDGDYDGLVERLGQARFVLLGEASHGTHEFYRERARITRRLIAEKNFTAVAVEGDWPEAYQVNRYVHCIVPRSEDGLAGFKRRFPTWMWRNEDVRDFVAWLRAHNESSRAETGFYGLDLYSLHASIEAVLDYLKRVDPDAAARARYRYSCFDHHAENPQAYGYAASFNMRRSCEDEVIAQLLELQSSGFAYQQKDGRAALDEFFYNEQNARLIKNAEAYYRAMFSSKISSWNLRDQHMAETVDALVSYYARTGSDAKIVVWAHNSHLGDARATEMGERQRELNIGQLMRERYGDEVVNVGFTTCSGTVTAASEWGAEAERKLVRQALPGSYEALFHQTDIANFLLDLNHPEVKQALSGPLLERAIGVIYLPESERLSHYFFARLPRQFDFVLHFDRTSAVEPLERITETTEELETYPSGM